MISVMERVQWNGPVGINTKGIGKMINVIK